MPDAAAFALALLRVDGLGAVSAHRLIERVPDLDALEACPREQLKIWLQGLPRADALVASLKEAGLMRERVEAARSETASLQERGIRTMAPPDAAWPAGLNDLEPAHRPVVLYAYGNGEALQNPMGAVLGRAPVEGPAYEIAQDAARALWRAGAAVGLGAQPGFDVAFHRLAERTGPAVLVAASGLARVPGPARPSISAALRGGGVLLSPFPMEHGPFEHDGHTASRVLVALSRAALFVQPQPDSPEARALDWAREHGRSRFVAGSPPDQSGLVEIERPGDVAWFVESVASPRT